MVQILHLKIYKGRKRDLLMTVLLLHTLSLINERSYIKSFAVFLSSFGRLYLEEIPPPLLFNYYTDDQVIGV